MSNLVHNQEDLLILMILLKHVIMLGKKKCADITVYQIKKLTLLQRPRAEEDLLLLCYNYRPNSELLKDYLTVQWLKDYTLATCKFMLGEARSKFATIAGPQGGTSLNGDALKAEAQVEIDKLDEELRNYVDGSDPLSFIIG